MIWTAAAHNDLLFWRRINFANLSAPISHDALYREINTWVISPNSGKIASDVRMFAVDTSNYASGGGEFMRDGQLWKMKGKMVVLLTAAEVLTSSTMRELLGLKRLDLAVIPDDCTKAIVAMDSLASVICMLNGSRVESLQQVVRDIYKNQLRHNRVLWPVWVRRNNDIIVQCDTHSRQRDTHAYTMAPAIFWRANAVAVELWGKGFQLDVGADMHNVQPADCSQKLPFFSRWCSPHSSGVDMFQCDWEQTVNWCNPPFALIPRVLALIRAQRACAAVVVPVGRKAWWAKRAQRGAYGVMRVLQFDPNRPAYRSSGTADNKRNYSQNYAVVFFDFSQAPPRHNFCSAPSAESFTHKVCTTPTYSLLHWREASPAYVSTSQA